MVLIAALDVGGTTLKGLVTRSGEVVAERRWPTPRGGPERVISAVVDAAQQLCDLCVSVTGSVPDAVGVAALGLVDADAGVALRSSTVGWSDVPLASLVRERVGVPVFLAHDIASAASAEVALLADDTRNVLFLAIGTGIGATLVVEGVPVGGAHHRAGEIGHVPVTGAVLECGCGRRGCLETVASGRAIGEAYAARSGRASTTAQQVAVAATGGDVVAVQVWRRATDALAEVLATCSMILDPSTIIVGGGLSHAGPQLLAPVDRGIRARLPFPGAPAVVTARLGDRAAMLGVATIAAARLAALGQEQRA